MPGKLCPKCGSRKLWEKNDGNYECSNCGYRLQVPVNGGKGGKGQRCPICKRYTFFDGKCRNCGAREK